MTPARGPIGIFDSGVGGLTVLRAVRAALPHEAFIYLGDTARLPYGTKSADSVVRYSLQCADALAARGIGCLVVACNTASAAALDALRRRHPRLPVLGVIEPGAAAAVAATRNRHIAVIGTDGTVDGGAYQSAIRRLDARVRVSATACSLFVALAEEGWVDGAIARSVAQRYLGPLFGADSVGRQSLPDTLVLGCTHFPVLATAIRAVLPPQVVIVDSAATVAAAIARELNSPSLPPRAAGGGGVTWLATDGAARFARVSGIFLGESVRAADVEIIDL